MMGVAKACVGHAQRLRGSDDVMDLLGRVRVRMFFTCIVRAIVPRRQYCTGTGR